MAMELPAEMDGRISAAVVLWEKKLEQPPVARSPPQHCRGVSECWEQLGIRW